MLLENEDDMQTRISRFFEAEKGPEAKRARTGAPRSLQIGPRGNEPAAAGHVIRPPVYPPSMCPDNPDEIAIASVAARLGVAALTPLEQQVVSLKAGASDALLLVEVGYKFLAFGEDALHAAAALDVQAFERGKYDSCWFPCPPPARAYRAAAVQKVIV